MAVAQSWHSPCGERGRREEEGRYIKTKQNNNNK